MIKKSFLALLTAVLNRVVDVLVIVTVILLLPSELARGLLVVGFALNTIRVYGVPEIVT